MDARIITSLVCAAAAVGCFVAASIYDAKAKEEQEALRTQRLADFNAASEKMVADLHNLTAKLDENLVTAKFWDIITRNQ